MNILAMMASDAGEITTIGMTSAAGLSGILIALGMFLKHQTPLKNHADWIPMILLVLGVGAFLTLSWPPTVNTVILAVGSALSAVGTYSTTKHTNAAVKPKQ